MLAVFLHAQSPFSCGTHRFYEVGVKEGYRTGNELAKIDEEVYAAQHDPRFRTTADTVHYTIPVAYHIMHNYGPEELSEQEVIASLRHLNDAFANVGYYDPSTGAPIDISFCFARTDKWGRPSDGYEWIPGTDYTELNFDGRPYEMMNIFAWEPKYIMNVYSVAKIEYARAFATFPAEDENERINGIVCEYDILGADSTLTSILAHEVGHYLGLYHTFQGGCNNDDCELQGDRVCDTPPDNYDQVFEGCTPNNNCPTDANADNPDNPFTSDGWDMNNNYMDYNQAECLNGFTLGQRSRMRHVLRLFRPSLTQSPACNPDPADRDISIYTLKGIDRVNFGDSIFPKVRIINHGNTILYNLDLIFLLDGVPFDTVPWTGVLRGEGRLAWVEDIPGIAAPDPGRHEMAVVASMPNGVPDELAVNDTVRIEFIRPNEGFIPHFEDHEDGHSDSWIRWERPGDEWQIIEAGDCETEDEDYHGNQTVVARSLWWVTPRNTYLYSPIFDFALHDDPRFLFYHAFARQSALENAQWFVCSLIREEEPDDEIPILVTRQTGLLDAIVYDTTAPWVPSTCEHWTQRDLDLSEYAGERVVLKIEHSIGRNNLELLYLDNFEVTSSYVEEKELVGVEESDIRFYPVPNAGLLHCEFPVFKPTSFDINIYAVDGRKVYTESQVDYLGEYEGLYELGRLADGIYYFRLEIDDRVIDRKFAIQK